MADNASDFDTGLVPPADTPSIPPLDDRPPADNVGEPPSGDSAATEQPEGEQPEGEEQLAEGEEGDDAAIEVELEGKIYQVPKALEKHLMREADYTQKTQALAEDRRRHAETMDQLAKMHEIERALSDDVLQIKLIDKQLEEYNTIDWDTWSRQAPAETQRHHIQFLQLKDQRAALVQQLDQKGYEKQQEIDRARSAYEQETVAKAVTALKAPDPDFGWPGYTPQYMHSLTSAMDEMGVPREEQKRIRSPLAIKIVSLAVKQWRAERAARRVTVKPQAQPASNGQGNGQAPVEHKLPRRVGGSKAPVNPDNEPIDKWMQSERQRMNKLGIRGYN